MLKYFIVIIELSIPREKGQTSKRVLNEMILQLNSERKRKRKK